MEGGWWLLAHAHRHKARGAAYLGVARSQPSWCGEELSLCASAVPQQCFSLLDCLLGCGGSVAIGSFKFIPTLSAWQPSPKRLPFSNRKMREIPCNLALGLEYSLFLSFSPRPGEEGFWPCSGQRMESPLPQPHEEKVPTGEEALAGRVGLGRPRLSQVATVAPLAAVGGLR